MKEGKSASLKINILQLKEKDQETCKNVCKLKYAEEIKYLKASEKRFNFIVKLSTKMKTTSLFLFNGNEFGKRLHKEIQEQNPDKEVYYVDGSIPGNEREKIRKKVMKKNDSILVCSYQTFSTGVNIKNLNCLVFTTPTKSEIKVLQSIGRILRIGDMKNVTLFDIVDDFCYKSSKNYSFKHFLERVKYYNKEKFKYRLKKLVY